MDSKQKKVASGVGLIGSIIGILYTIDPDTFLHYLSATAASEVARATFYFSIAAWIHSYRVKKEIKTNFQAAIEAVQNNFIKVTDAINNVAVALKKDLALQDTRIGKIESGLTQVITRVDRLEKP